MKRSSSNLLRSALFAVGAIAVTADPLQADAQSVPVTYVITSTIGQLGGTLESVEYLTIDATGTNAVVTLAQPSSGQSAVINATIDEHGVLGIASADPALACYNTAQHLLADAGGPNATSAIQVAFAGNAVAVPLRVSPADFGSGVHGITVSGVVEGAINAQPGSDVAIAVDGNVATRAQLLVGAQLRETSLMVATRAPLTQTTCTLAHLVPQAPVSPV